MGCAMFAVATLSNPEEAFSFLQTAMLIVAGPIAVAVVEGYYSLERQKLENDGTLRNAAVEAMAKKLIAEHGDEDEDDEAE